MFEEIEKVLDFNKEDLGQENYNHLMSSLELIEYDLDGFTLGQDDHYTKAVSKRVEDPVLKAKLILPVYEMLLKEQLRQFGIAKTELIYAIETAETNAKETENCRVGINFIKENEFKKSLEWIKETMHKDNDISFLFDVCLNESKNVEMAKFKVDTIQKKASK